MGNEERKYNVIIENALINNGQDSFIECLKEFYALYYNFNLEYPRRLSCSMEFLQRYIMKTHPDTGTKSSYFSASKKRVITFMKLLGKFEK